MPKAGKVDTQPPRQLEGTCGPGSWNGLRHRGRPQKACPGPTAKRRPGVAAQALPGDVTIVEEVPGLQRLVCRRTSQTGDWPGEAQGRLSEPPKCVQGVFNMWPSPAQFRVSTCLSAYGTSETSSSAFRNGSNCVLNATSENGPSKGAGRTVGEAALTPANLLNPHCRGE